MIFSFCRYFFHYIFHSKTRQNLLYLATGGLIISSFALLVVQSTMGGLQNKLVGRSKKVVGDGVIEFSKEVPLSSIEAWLSELKKETSFKAYPEYEMELLLKNGDILTPLMIHGYHPTYGQPDYLGENFKGLYLPRDFAYRAKVDQGQKITLISVSHVDSLFEEIPRTVSVSVEQTLNTDVPEVDLYQGWVHIHSLWSLTRRPVINRIRLFGNIGALKTSSLPFGGKLRLWEDQHETLVWALNLESRIMIILFVAMTVMVSLCITSGLLIFFDRIKNDLSSFWILGSSKKKIEWACGLFLTLLSFVSSLSGLILGLFFLWLLSRYGFDIMPDVFIDRKIPVYITKKGMAISFVIPFMISLLFSFFSLSNFKRETNYLKTLRSVAN